MFIGMGSVFLILGLLIVLINMVTNILSTFELEDEPVTSRTAFGATKKAAANPDGELVAVISSAIARYRKRHSKH